MNYGTGRIGDIIKALSIQYPNVPIKTLDPRAKLSALCEVLQMLPEQFDALIVDNSPVFRTVKGHAFESFFDQLLSGSGHLVTEVGGDDSIDRIVNGFTLQLKTPTIAGTSDTSVQFKTHKTHGAKSELESFDYYHNVNHFADFLIGLVSYEPLNIIVLDRGELPTHPLSETHIQSPFNVDFSTHIGLNNFSRIGIDEPFENLNSLVATDNELLPRCAKKLNLTTDVILNTVINEANFRVWDMAIRGFAREAMFQSFLADNDVATWNPSDVRRERPDKADHALQIINSDEYRFFQMKGLSVGNCRFIKEQPIVGVETQLTRGRVNDHPTQSRLYLATDFDYLIIGIDPPLNQLYEECIGEEPLLMWGFYAIPSEILQRHPIFTSRYKSVQTFNYNDIQQYKIDNLWCANWMPTIIDESIDDQMTVLSTPEEIEQNEI